MCSSSLYWPLRQRSYNRKESFEESWHNCMSNSSRGPLSVHGILVSPQDLEIRTRTPDEISKSIRANPWNYLVYHWADMMLRSPGTMSIFSGLASFAAKPRQLYKVGGWYLSKRGMLHRSEKDAGIIIPGCVMYHSIFPCNQISITMKVPSEMKGFHNNIS